MNTTPIIDRIKAQASGFKFIGGALDLNESTLLAVQYPAVFVLPMGEVASDNLSISATVQSMEQSWGILIAIKSLRTSASSDQSAELQTLRDSTRAALLGWAPDSASTSLQYERGELLGIESGVVLWQDLFTSVRHLIA